MPGVAQSGHRTDAAGELGVGGGAVHHLHVGLGEQGHLLGLDLGHMHGLQPRAEQIALVQMPDAGGAEPSAGRSRRARPLVLVQMNVHVGVSSSEYMRILSRSVIGHGVDRVGTESDVDERSLRYSSCSASPLWNPSSVLADQAFGNSMTGNADLCLEPGARRASWAPISGKEVHVGETGDAGADHLGHGQPYAVAARRSRPPSGPPAARSARSARPAGAHLRWSPQQRHGRVAVGVDQTRASARAPQSPGSMRSN